MLAVVVVEVVVLVGVFVVQLDSVVIVVVVVVVLDLTVVVAVTVVVVVVRDKVMDIAQVDSDTVQDIHSKAAVTVWVHCRLIVASLKDKRNLTRVFVLLQQ